MARGEKTFSTEGRNVARFDASPCPAKADWTAKLLGNKADIKKSDDSGRSRVSVAFEILESGAEGGRNKWIFNDFHLGLKPGKDGVVMLDRGNGLTALAAAIPTKLKGIRTIEIAVTNPKTGEITTEEALNAQDVLKWIKSLDGQLVTLASRVETGTGQYAGKHFAKIADFQAADAAVEEDEDEEETDEDEEVAEADEDEDTDEDEDDEDADEDDDEEEPVPVMKKKAKPVLALAPSKLKKVAKR